MWVPVINRVDGLPTFEPPAKMAYLFAQSIVPTVPASLLTFSTKATYPTYRSAPRMIHGLDALGDQQVAAAIMKVGAGGYLWSIVGALFFLWWTDSKKGLNRDNRRVVTSNGPVAGMTISGGRVEEQLTWAQVEAEFARLDEAQAGTL
jgi:putative membrane protein